MSTKLPTVEAIGLALSEAKGLERRAAERRAEAVAMHDGHNARIGRLRVGFVLVGGGDATEVSVHLSVPRGTIYLSPDEIARLGGWIRKHCGIAGYRTPIAETEEGEKEEGGKENTP